MAVGELGDEALMAALRAHPELRERVSSIVLAVESCDGDLKEADAAEERMVEETRLLGREPSREGKDKRKGKTLSWREAKLSLAHGQGSRTPVYAARSRAGSRRPGVNCCPARSAPASGRTPGSTRSATARPGSSARSRRSSATRAAIYLIDFYHVCEYLAAASETIAADPAARSAWMEAQKEALKGGRLDSVLRALAAHREPPEVEDARAPVRTCHRYLHARASQLNYRPALAEGLPIGSGEIESAHRYVAQQRLKRPGAWWRVEHAEHMLALRINRINGDWNAYWKALAKPSPAVANDNSPQKTRRRIA